MLLVLLLVGGVFSLAPRVSQHLTGDDLVDYLNTHQSHFKATNYQWTSAEMRAKAMDKKYVSAGDTPIAPKIDWIRDEEIPESFDARDKWKNCASVGHIRDQSQCGSCWAFGAAQVMTDRTCIHSKGLVKANVSIEDILSCCSSWNQECGSCAGGWPYNAFNYWNSVGVVTGGDYGTNDGCMPYVISPCGWHNGVNYGSCPPDEVATPKCAPQCRDGYSKTYQTDKTFGTPAYRIQPQSAVDIQKEIMTNGPVTNCFDLYQDFYHYKSGVYVYSAGDYVGGHCVKMLGWGTENGTPYWLVANSWDTDFGEKGFFRIIRGINECNFEEYVFGALPQY